MIIKKNICGKIYLVGSGSVKKNYFKRLDYIRVLSCIGVFLYHLNILKGGYLAVCTFFVMTGYLSVISAMKKENFNLLNYYYNRIKKIYIPLLVVVFSSIAIISFIESINWLNLKPETTSVLLGYNNFWQLNANLDYFVRHVSSPFIHLWYIAIILQFELVFPLVFILFKKIGNKISKAIPCLFFFMLGLASYVYFCQVIKDGNIMSAYYGTFTRAFSLLFGVSLGFIHSYYKPLVFKNRNLNKLIFSIYMLLTIIMYFIMGTDFCSFSISMIIATLLSMRLIDYAAINLKKNNVLDEVVSSLSNVSYEIYLVQYPVIFILQNITMNEILRVVLTIIITIILSYLIHASLNIKKAKIKIVNIILCILVLSFSGYGVYKYIVTEDHTEEMKRLEEKLNENSKLIEEQKQQYLENKKNEEDEWKKVLEDLNAGEEKLKETVTNMSIVGIGDSIMELAVKDLYKQFPNGLFDAKTNRTEKEVNGILKDLKSKGLLPDIIIMNIGTNGSWSKKNKEEMLEIIGDRKIFWLNATNPDYAIFNDYLKEFADSHNNVYIIDWIKVMKDNPGYLISDKVHPTVKGCKLYAQTIYDYVYDYYLKEYNKIREEKIKEHDELENKKIVFVGNELLLGMYDYIHDDYNESEFIIDKEYTYEKLKNQITSKIEDKSLAHNVVLLLDEKIKMSSNDYNDLFELLKDYNIYIIDINNNLNFDNENVNVIRFINNSDDEKKYISFDGIHLTEKGSSALKDKIEEIIKK